MQKRNLMTALAFLVVGAISLILALATETILDNILIGIAGAGLVPGSMLVIRSIIWHLPKNKSRRMAVIEQQTIEQHDELKVQLRDRAGHLCYLISLFMLGVMLISIAILSELGVITSAVPVFILLGSNLILMLLIFPILYRALLKHF